MNIITVENKESVGKSLGSSRMQLGAIEGSAALIVAMMSAFAGIRSDRKGTGGGRIVWIRWGYGLLIIGKSLIASATMWPLVIGGRLLDRFGKGLRGAPRDALIANAVCADQRGRAFGLHRAFDTAGALTGIVSDHSGAACSLTQNPQSGRRTQVSDDSNAETTTFD